ncbi:MAG: 2-C-methyl-D-erythritol 4-phosphate cytidylyltransferase [Spirochaetaceae bacterium]|jgi:2-C-methyl-D-erythritol 4-phosphate cytidylyltransferase/2-C-methyl-D-erythritol 2,4-cyclodiphosphate synthase|nr:2-C-methyl-D-erythritol 4-phosphate cytidylyltransferase [Spirochaetaceae bacterium]
MMTTASDSSGDVECGPVWVIIAAAGESARMGGVKKEFLSLSDGKCVLAHAAAPFIDLPGLKCILVVLPATEHRRWSVQAEAALGAAGIPLQQIRFVPGGGTRQESVRLALEAVRDSGGNGTVLIHDGARPFVPREVVRRVLRNARETGAAVPVIPPADTIKRVNQAGDSLTLSVHLTRAELRAVQTPQGFHIAPLLEAHQKARSDGKAYTDDSEIWHNYVGPVRAVEGSPENIKLTTPGDLPETPPFRIGLGWDRHRLIAGRRLLLGGVAIPSERGEDGHSDGDVLLHAVTDAFLGAAGMGDLGERFSPEDPRWKDADSAELLRAVWDEVGCAGWALGNLDCVVMLERPRVLPYRTAICGSIAEILGVPPGRIFVKGKTGEGIGEVGRLEAVEATVTALLARQR